MPSSTLDQGTGLRQSTTRRCCTERHDPCRYGTHLMQCPCGFERGRPRGQHVVQDQAGTSPHEAGTARPVPQGTGQVPAASPRAQAGLVRHGPADPQDRGEAGRRPGPAAVADPDGPAGQAGDDVLPAAASCPPRTGNGHEETGTGRPHGQVEDVGEFLGQGTGQITAAPFLPGDQGPCHGAVVSRAGPGRQVRWREGDRDPAGPDPQVRPAGPAQGPVRTAAPGAADREHEEGQLRAGPCHRAPDRPSRACPPPRPPGARCPGPRRRGPGRVGGRDRVRPEQARWGVR